MMKPTCFIIATVFFFSLTWGRPVPAEAQTGLAGVSQRYGTFLGGQSDDQVRAIAVDGQGYIYLTGWTYSTDFPGLNGKQNDNQDIFVTRLNPQGTAIDWTIHLGGGGIDAGHALALDGQGGLWLTGVTGSADFPVSPGGNPLAGYYDVIVVKLDAASGAIQFSNRFGGPNLDEGNGLAVGSNGTVYVTGQVSDEFNRPDVLVMAFASQSNTLLTMAHFGRERGEDVGTAIALDAENNLYLTGWTEAAGQADDFPLVDPFQAQCGLGDGFGDCGRDAFLTIIDPEITGLRYSTYLGGGYNGSEISAGDDSGTGLAVGPDGSVYVTGYTFATDFPLANPVQASKRGADNIPDAFALRFDPSTNALIFSTYLGGDGWDEGQTLGLDELGNVYVVGLTASQNFPSNAAFQPRLGAGVCNVGGTERYCYDSFVTKLTATGSLTWSSYLGGLFDDSGQAIILDPAGGLLIAGSTESVDFPVSAGGLQPVKRLNRDGFLVRLGAGGGGDFSDYQVYLPVVLR